MSYSGTTNLGLRKDGSDEKIRDWRPHMNQNLDIIDQEIQDIIDSDVVVLKEGDGSSAGPIFNISAPVAPPPQPSPGTAIPRPDAPVAIKSIVEHGRNLFSGTAGTGTLKKDGTINTNTGATTYCYSYYIEVEEGAPYCCTNISSYWCWYDSSKTFLSYSDIYNYTSEYGSSITAIAPEGAAYMRVCYLQTKESKVQVERGLEPTPYVPHDCIAIDVRTRNLLRYTVGKGTYAGVTISIQSDGSMVLNGWAKGDITYPFYASPKYDYKENTSTPIVLSGIPDGSLTTYHYRVRYFDASTYAPQDTEDVLDGGTISTYSDTRARYAVLLFIHSGTRFNNLTIYPQVEHGSTPTEYVPRYHKVIGVPLPAPRGYVASLGDGYADTVSIDSAGHAVWQTQTWKVSIASDSTVQFSGGATDDGEHWYGGIKPTNYAPPIPGIALCTHAPYASTLVNINALRASKSPAVCPTGNYIYAIAAVDSSTALLDAYVGATVLYPTSARMTLDAGYVPDMPTDIPIGASITCEELGTMSVTYFSDPSAINAVQQWHDRSYAELGDAITELTARVAALEA